MQNAATASTHTAGPWDIVNSKMTDDTDCIYDSEGQFIAQVGLLSEDVKSSQETSANARLVAAAPDLLEACYAALELKCPDGDDHECGVIARINDAIAKAEGRA